MSGDSVLEALRSHAPGEVTVLFAKGSLKLHAMVTSAGYDDLHQPGYDWHGLRRGRAPFVLLQHSMSGRGQLRWEKQRFEVGAGETMLLRFPNDNRYWLARDDHWEFFWLCLNGREVLRIWGDLLQRTGPVVRLPAPVVAQLADFCHFVLSGAAVSAPAASAIAYAATMALTEAVIPTSTDILLPVPSGAIGRAIALCHASIADPQLDVTGMAEVAGLTRPHFTRLFTAATGISPARYLMRLRMEAAVRLLQSGVTSVKQVSLRCGFSDANYFAKAFRRIYGQSPRDLRRGGAWTAGLRSVGPEES
jgi:AraC family transcriptional regulator